MNVVSLFFFIFATSNNCVMSYTKEPIIIDRPSEKLLKTVEMLREQKLAKLERLRGMKPEDFSRRVILT